MDLDTGWGFAVACPHGKEKGKEPPTLGRGSGSLGLGRWGEAGQGTGQSRRGGGRVGKGGSSPLLATVGTTYLTSKLAMNVPMMGPVQ